MFFELEFPPWFLPVPNHLSVPGSRNLEGFFFHVLGIISGMAEFLGIEATHGSRIWSRDLVTHTSKHAASPQTQAGKQADKQGVVPLVAPGPKAGVPALPISKGNSSTPAFSRSSCKPFPDLLASLLSFSFLETILSQILSPWASISLQVPQGSPAQNELSLQEPGSLLSHGDFPSCWIDTGFLFPSRFHDQMWVGTIGQSRHPGLRGQDSSFSWSWQMCQRRWIIFLAFTTGGWW